MVGLVIVSHSAKIAEGIKDLAEQVKQGESQVAAAGGIDDPENPIGTDAVKIHAAIESVYSEDGVLVLMDLGSAMLSAQMALEFLLPEQKEKVKLCAAPVVEGAIAAAVQASLGSSLQEVMDEALGALSPKKEQLDPDISSGASPVTDHSFLPPEEAEQTTLTVLNPMGLHTRPAANLVRSIATFQADITLCKGQKTANAKSINQVATLGAGQGDRFVVTAFGPDAELALETLQTLAKNRFGEQEEVHKPDIQRAPDIQENGMNGELIGIPASPGIAIGPVFHYRAQLPEISLSFIDDPAKEWEQLQPALDEAKKELDALNVQASRKLGPAEAEIFDAHRLFLDDPALLDTARKKVFEQKMNIASAWQQAIDELADQYRNLEDAYLRERAVDVIDVGRRVLRQLLEEALPSFDVLQPSILVATELTPSDTAELDPKNILAICTERGGNISHSAIVAKALGIPAIAGLNYSVTAFPEGQVIALDGSTGQLWLDPSKEQLEELQNKRDAWHQHREQSKLHAKKPAITRGDESRTIEVAANIGGPRDARLALDYGADSVGLLRTELYFQERSQAPTEEEQLLVYKQVAQIMERRALIIRTLDVGGDKIIPYLDMKTEENPFLGLRGIRFHLKHSHLLKTQLRALLQAGVDHNVHIMFPMVSNVYELRAAKAVLSEAKQELKEEGRPFIESVKVGIMIEVPSAVVIADQLAREVDFFSIGSNDLTQYVMAADRGNSKVTDLVNALHPAVLRLIARTAKVAKQAGIPVGMCGELAGNPLATPVLVGMGLKELSMNAPGIPEVKSRVRLYSMQEAREIACKVVELESAEEVSSYLRENEKE